MTDAKKLRELAEKATPGEWRTGDHIDEPRALVPAGSPMVSLLALDRDGMAIVDTAADAAFIAAANPAAVLALLDRLDAAEAVCISRVVGGQPMSDVFKVFDQKYRITSNGEKVRCTLRGSDGLTHGVRHVSAHHTATGCGQEYASVLAFDSTPEVVTCLECAAWTPLTDYERTVERNAEKNMTFALRYGVARRRRR